MIYNIYHDESKKDAFWHCFLFIPLESENELFNALKSAKKNTDFQGEMHFRKMDFTRQPSYGCSKSWLSILIASFQQKNGAMEPYWVGKQKYHSKEWERKEAFKKKFSKPLKVKIAIFRQDNHHQDMSGHFDKLSKIETTFRMGIQGATHYLFDESNPIEANKMIIDGENHYQMIHKRPIDKEKIVSKLKANSRSFFTFTGNFEIRGESLSEKEKEFIDLADCFLGVFRAGIIRPSSEYCTNDNERKKYELCELIKQFFDDKLNRGTHRMRNSRFEKFGTFSSAKIENDNWKFSNIHQDFLNPPSKQGKLF